METPNNIHRIVTTWKEVHELTKHCKQTGYCSSDFETTGTNAMYPGAKPTVLGVSFQPGSSWIIPLAHKESPFKDWERVLKYFGREVIENPKIIKIGQNIKFEMNWWKKYNIQMVGRVFDTMLAKYLLDEERPHGLKDMVGRFLPEFAGYDLPGKPGEKATIDKVIEFWSNVPLKTLAQYCGLDSDLTFRLWIFFERRLIDNGFYQLFRNMMMMASRVLSEAEWRGMVIDTEYLKDLKGIYAEKIEACEYRLRNNPKILLYEKHRVKRVKKEIIQELLAEIEELRKENPQAKTIITRQNKIKDITVGKYTNKKDFERMEPINFGSQKQMVELLFTDPHGFNFDIIRYTVDKKTKKESDNPSTDESVLEELKLQDESGFIHNLLELRGLTTLNNTFIVGMWERLYSTNKVHGSFLLHGTVTGRLSSRNPNLQNIPREATSSDIKRMFVAPKGKVVLQVDYSQAELRVLAAAAKEETMMSWFSTGKDVHLASACLKYGVSYDDIIKIYKDESHKDYKIWVVRRKQAKTINFGIVYGQTAKKLAIGLSTDTHKVSLEEAQQFLDDFNEQFPRIAKFIKKQQALAKKQGFVYNLFGRKRRLPNVDSDNWGKKAEALRQSINAPIQGAASDFALFSSIIIREAILFGDMPKSLEQVGTVHDSLIFYIDPADLATAVPMIYAICRNPETKTWFNFEIKGIEMQVDFEVGSTWGKVKRYEQGADYSKLAA